MCTLCIFAAFVPQFLAYDLATGAARIFYPSSRQAGAAFHGSLALWISLFARFGNSANGRFIRIGYLLANGALEH